MRARFCESTSDIFLGLSIDEALKLKRGEGFTPVITAEDKGLVFHLMNPKSANNIRVDEPRAIQAHPHYWIVIDDAAYAALVRDGECGDRYGASYKIKVFIDEPL